MSLATRCPVCATTFRVVQDQLKISEGWVRCGRCNDVFNALEGLFDLDLPNTVSVDAPTLASVEVPALDTPVSAQSFLSQPSTQEEPPSSDPEESVPAAMPWASQVAAEESDPQTAYEVLDSRFLDRSTYGPTLQPDAEDGFANAQYDSSFLPDEELPTPPPPVQTEQPTSTPPSQRRRSKGRPAPSKPEPSGPEFLRQAERKAQWEQPRIRALLGALGVFLSIALVVQIGLAQRHWLAAHYPGMRPVVHGLAASFGTRIEPLRNIDDVVIEGSSLSQGTTPRSYKLSVLLRNRSSVDLAVPAVELTLIGADGETVTRRAVSPTEFQATRVIPARSELPLDLAFSTAGQRVAGYTVEAFYP